jgi:catechol 2,3-dioxygenase-like lactoylglutathione lyase family enzyme
MRMHIGHVALRVTDLERSIDHVESVLGLRVRTRSDGEALLTSNEKHHELQLIAAESAGLDHVGLEVESAADLDEVRARSVAAGAQLLEGRPDVAGLGAAVRFSGPAGIVYEVYDGMERDPLSIHTHLRPGVRKFGHLTFLCEQPEQVVAFWRDGLGFRTSDEAGGITWMRCDADHHGLSVGPRPAGNVLHHYAWQVQDLGALGQCCDDVARLGLTLDWGPVRHGPGFNLAAYLRDPDNAIIEIYADLLEIHDERAYERIDWSNEPRALNLWGPMPSEELLAAGVPILTPAAEQNASPVGAGRTGARL